MAGALPQREVVSIKGRALPQPEMGSKKNAGVLPQGDPGSKKFMALPISKKSGAAAAMRNGQYKKRGRCRSENWSV